MITTLQQPHPMIIRPQVLNQPLYRSIPQPQATLLQKTGSSPDTSADKSTPTGNIFGASAAQTAAVLLALVLLTVIALGAKKPSLKAH